MITNYYNYLCNLKKLFLLCGTKEIFCRVFVLKDFVDINKMIYFTEILKMGVTSFFILSIMS
uniref:Uncharacterized protein n=1 Tax=Anguilla anguilla TaxID=7936 RepID=A0A0E9WXZ4_ANGAN